MTKIPFTFAKEGKMRNVLLEKPSAKWNVQIVTPLKNKGHKSQTFKMFEL